MDVIGGLADISSDTLQILAILRVRDRAVAGRIAPPNGLCLWEVGYEVGSVTA